MSAPTSDESTIAASATAKADASQTRSRGGMTIVRNEPDGARVGSTGDWRSRQSRARAATRSDSTVTVAPCRYLGSGKRRDRRNKERFINGRSKIVPKVK